MVKYLNFWENDFKKKKVIGIYICEKAKYLSRMLLNAFLMTDLQGTLAGGSQRQRQVHKGLESPGLAVAGKTLHSGLELALKQRHNDGLVQQLVFAPGLVCCGLIV